MKSDKIKNVLLILLVFSSFLLIGKAAYCVPKGYIFSDEGSYILFNSSDYSVVGEGNFRQDILEGSKDIKLKNILKKTSIYEVFPDIEGNRIFLSLGQGQENKMYGFLILQLDPLKFQHFFELDMTLGPIGFLMYQKEKRLYLSYVKGNDNKGYESITAAFDSQSYALINKYTNPLFRIFPKGSCLIGDRLYQAGGMVFDIATGEQI